MSAPEPVVRSECVECVRVAPRWERRVALTGCLCGGSEQRLRRRELCRRGCSALRPARDSRGMAERQPRYGRDIAWSARARPRADLSFALCCVTSQPSCFRPRRARARSGRSGAGGAAAARAAHGADYPRLPELTRAYPSLPSGAAARAAHGCAPRRDIQASHLYRICT